MGLRLAVLMSAVRALPYLVDAALAEDGALLLLRCLLLRGATATRLAPLV